MSSESSNDPIDPIDPIETAPADPSGAAGGLTEGSRVDRYTIRAYRDATPGSEVYCATDDTNGAMVALEVFPAVSEADLCRRFDVFVSQFAGVELPGISPVLDSGLAAGRPFVVRRWIEGETLAAMRAGRGPLRADEAVCLILPVADHLARAHGRGLIHGEILADSLRIDPGGLIYLEGFGSAALRAEADPDEPLTVGGDLAGLAVVFEGLLAGKRGVRPPEGPPSDTEKSIPKVRVEYSRAAVSQADLSAILFRAKTAEGWVAGPGYASVAEFAADLRAWLMGCPVMARPRSTGERMRLWCHLNPVAATALITVLGVLLAAPVLTALWVRGHPASGATNLSSAQRAEFDYVAGIQRAHAALEAGAMERLDALLTASSGKSISAMTVGPERGLLRAWLEVQPRERLVNLSGPIQGIAVSADGAHLAVWTPRGVEVLVPHAGQFHEPVRWLGTNSPLSVDFLPDGRTAVVGTAAGVHLAPVAGEVAGRGPKILTPEGATQVSVSPGGRWLAAVSSTPNSTSKNPQLGQSLAGSSVSVRAADWTVKIWPLLEGSVAPSARLSLGPVLAWAWVEPEPGAPRLAVALRDGQAGHWDLLKTNYSGVVRAEEDWTAAAWDRRGRLLARLDAVGSLELISFTTGEMIARHGGHAGRNQLLAVAPDGSRAAATTTGGDVAVYRAPEWTNFAVLPTRREELTTLKFLPDGALLTGTRSGAVWRWEPQPGARQPGTVTPNHLPFAAGRPCFSPDGNWLALPDERQSDEDGFVVLHPGQLGDPEPLTGQPVGFISPDVLLAWERGAARWEAWSMASRKRVATGRLADREEWNWATLSADGAILVARAPGDRLEAFQLGSGIRLARLEERVETAAVNADGSVVAVGLADSMGLWAPAAGVLRRSPGRRAVVTAVSPDGLVAAYGDERGQVRIWRPTLGQIEELPADGVGIRALAFGGEGRTLLVANEASLLQAWHLGTRLELFSRSLAHPAEWLVMAPNDAGLIVGYPAPPGEATGSYWWWPVAGTEHLRPPRAIGASKRPLPTWLKSAVAP